MTKSAKNRAKLEASRSDALIAARTKSEQERIARLLALGVRVLR
jgi:hypothetical protein